MNILNLCTFYHRATIFFDLASRLRERGHVVKIFSAAAKGDPINPNFHYLFDENVVHQECYTKWDRFVFFRKQRKLKRAVEGAYDVSSFDVLHAHTLFNGGYAAYKLHLQYAVPYVVSVRSTDLDCFLKIPGFDRIANKILANASGVLFLSESAKKTMIEKHVHKGIRDRMEKKSSVIYNGVDSFWLDNGATQGKELKGNPVRMLCVARINKNKNIDSIVKAMDLLEQQGYAFRLQIIGRVMDETLARELAKDQRVEIVSYIPKEQLLAYYKGADIFVLPSFKETFGRAYAEAMTQALPVVYTAGQGFDKIFPQGEVGYAVNAHDVQDIALGIESILQRYSELSNNCVKHYLTFDWKDIAVDVERLYKKAADGGVGK